MGVQLNDFEPIVARGHQPPPVHQTLRDGVVVCSFCRGVRLPPRPSRADKRSTSRTRDLYASEEFLSRKGRIRVSPINPTIQHGRILTVRGVYRQKFTNELAVMMTRSAAQGGEAGRKSEDPGYHRVGLTPSRSSAMIE